MKRLMIDINIFVKYTKYICGHYSFYYSVYNDFLKKDFCHAAVSGLGHAHCESWPPPLQNRWYRLAYYNSTVYNTLII